MAMARPLFQGLICRPPLLARPHSITACTKLAQQFHMTATNPTRSSLSRSDLMSTNPQLPKTFPGKIKSIYTDKFPYSLFYYCTYGPKLALRDGDKLEGSFDDLELDPHYCRENSVSVNKDGLVDPANTSRWNGVPMFPNSKNQQTLIDGNLGWAEILRDDHGREVPTAWIFTIPKGTALPRSLFLVHEDDGMGESFHLLPRTAMPLPDLNEELNTFFSTNGMQNAVDDMWVGFYDQGYSTWDKEWMLR